MTYKDLRDAGAAMTVSAFGPMLGMSAGGSANMLVTSSKLGKTDMQCVDGAWFCG